MITYVRVENINIVDLVELALLRIGREYTDHVGVKAATEQHDNVCLFEALLIIPLSLVFKFRSVE